MTTLRIKRLMRIDIPNRAAKPLLRPLTEILAAVAPAIINDKDFVGERTPAKRLKAFL
jgi:hypothetical protein